MAAPVEQITLYTAKICPYAHRTEIALAEAGVDYTRFEIDLQNKPEWYAPQVNPASKVPAIAYGGPPVPADQPSPASTKIAESLILLELLADLFPHIPTLLPSSPVLRAKARFFIDTFGTKLLPLFYQFQMRGDASVIPVVLEGAEAIQKLLPEEGDFALGKEFSNADAAVAPFFARWELALSKDLGAYDEGEGKKLWAAFNEPKFARLMKYFKALKERESVKKTFHEDHILQVYAKRLEDARAQRKAKASA